MNVSKYLRKKIKHFRVYTIVYIMGLILCLLLFILWEKIPFDYLYNFNVTYINNLIYFIIMFFIILFLGKLSKIFFIRIKNEGSIFLFVVIKTFCSINKITTLFIFLLVVLLVLLEIKIDFLQLEEIINGLLMFSFLIYYIFFCLLCIFQLANILLIIMTKKRNITNLSNK